MLKDYTDITLLVDRSGSMSMLHDDVVGGLNRFVEEQRKLPGKVTLSAYQFDTVYDAVVEYVDLNYFKGFTKDNFVPRGGTALLDAIGKTVNSKGLKFSGMKEEDRPEKVIIVIFTDGLENSSVEFSRSKIQEMLKHQQAKYSWEIIYLGADQDSIREGANLGLLAGKSQNWDKTSYGLQTACLNASTYTSNLRNGKAGW